MKYSSTVASVSDSGVEPVTSGFGPFEVANFAVKGGLKEIGGKDGEFRVTFARVDETGVETNIVSVTGDADVVTYVAKKKIAAERKALSPADAGTESTNETDPSGE